jgi:hypothetical protein
VLLLLRETDKTVFILFSGAGGAVGQVDIAWFSGWNGNSQTYKNSFRRRFPFPTRYEAFLLF